VVCSVNREGQDTGKMNAGKHLATVTSIISSNIIKVGHQV
jgi:hypothetical protein